MTLQMDRVARALPRVVAGAREQGESLETALAGARLALDRWAGDPEAGNAAIEAAMAETDRPFATVHAGSPLDVIAPPAFAPVTVVAADGSSIEPDRFAAVQCFVVNTGWAVLPYSTAVPPVLDSRPALGPLAEAAAAGTRTWGVNLRRDVAELETGARLASANLPGGPVVLLLDGTLFPWDLDSRQVDPALRREFKERTQDALDLLHTCGETFSMGTYISGSRAADVVTSLGALGEHGAAPPPVAFGDHHLFARLLAHGQRSAVFRARSQRMHAVEAMFSPAHQVCFFYLRVGDDIARVELPHWAAAAARVGRLHATVVDQCARCDGYPRALQEAHEQAVISTGDRAQFARLLEDESWRQGLRSASNSKQMSKRSRAL